MTVHYNEKQSFIINAKRKKDPVFRAIMRYLSVLCVCVCATRFYWYGISKIVIYFVVLLHILYERNYGNASARVNT